MTQKLNGYLVRVGNALLACPCYLLLTVALLAGTLLEGTNRDNRGLTVIGIAGFLLLALVLAARIFAIAAPIRDQCREHDI
ncbi:MAG: hypothetical protein HY675_01775 [Chloroflexi bacterium]|nr:hypothetical protein [Chloroflexota bacterium]